MTLGRQDAIAHIARAKEPKKLPVVLSGEEIVRFLEAIPELRSRAALTTAYGAGLRVSEVAALKIGDLDSGRMLIRVEHGKGGKDRYVMLSPQLLTILRIYWRLAKPAHWLFPGGPGQAGQHRHAAGGLSGGGAGGRLGQAGHHPHPAPQLRHPSARGGHRHSHHPGPARPQPAGDHRDLHPRRHQRHRRHAQPADSLAGLACRLADARCAAPSRWRLRATPWVVFAKRPFGGPEQVLDYLGRYTHRVAITNRRLVSLHETRVSFLWKDYRHHDKRKVMTLDADEFIRRFLLHVLPDGFHRIRHYGYLANGQRAAKLALCRRLLAAPAPPSPAMAGDYRERYHQLTGRSLELCPCCGGRMVQIALIPRPATPGRPASLDTS